MGEDKRKAILDVWLKSGKLEVERAFDICALEQKTGIEDIENKLEKGHIRGARHVSVFGVDNKLNAESHGAKIGEDLKDAILSEHQLLRDVGATNRETGRKMHDDSEALPTVKICMKRFCKRTCSYMSPTHLLQTSRSL